MDEASCSPDCHRDSYDRSFVDDDDDSYSPESVKENKPKMSSSNQHGVVRQENDIVMSRSDERFKEITDSDVEKFVQIREKGKTPNAEKTADDIMGCLREIMERGGGRYLTLRKNPSRYVEINEDEARESKFIRFELRTDT